MISFLKFCNFNVLYSLSTMSRHESLHYYHLLKRGFFVHSKPMVTQMALVGYKTKHEDMNRGKGPVGKGNLEESRWRETKMYFIPGWKCYRRKFDLIKKEAAYGPWGNKPLVGPVRRQALIGTEEIGEMSSMIILKIPERIPSWSGVSLLKRAMGG